MLGGNENAGLLTMLKRYDQLTQSIAKAIKVSCQINGVMKVNTYMDDEQKKAEREKFDEELKTTKAAFYIQICQRNIPKFRAT